MSITDDIYRKQIELNEVESTLRSINPKLSLHEKLSKRRTELLAEIACLEEKRPPITLSKAPQKVRSRLSTAKKQYATKL